MKRVLLGFALIGLALAAGCVETVDAQTLPITLHVEWTPNPASDAVTGYTFTLDTGAAQAIDPSTCTATICRSASFAINDTNVHQVSLTATNTFGTSTPATASFTVKISTPSGLKIQKG
ncbi:MAG TPA: hypothetical protein VFV60_04195 [bacterium]|nr:hypothetical protein [bacterium]